MFTNFKYDNFSVRITAHMFQMKTADLSYT